MILNFHDATLRAATLRECEGENLSEIFFNAEARRRGGEKGENRDINKKFCHPFLFLLRASAPPQ
jgi:hypothetical protein